MRLAGSGSVVADGRPAVAMGSKDGHLYIVDRRSHRLLSKTPVTTVLNQEGIVRGVRAGREITSAEYKNGVIVLATGDRFDILRRWVPSFHQLACRIVSEN